MFLIDENDFNKNNVRELLALFLEDKMTIIDAFKVMRYSSLRFNSA